MQTIDSYWQDGFNKVEGWVGDLLINPLKLISSLQLEKDIRGGAMEVGVHHGKLLIALALMTRKDEFTVGIDVFESQHLNIDCSGYGSYTQTLENIKLFCNSFNKIELIIKDSLSINSADVSKLIHDYGPFRIISIDGGHTPEHTYNDLIIGQNVLQSGGVIMLDDYYNMHWPGVHEGVARYFIGTCSKLKPFCAAHNKLFLCEYTYHSTYMAIFEEHFQNEEMFKKVQMWGADVVVY